MEKRRPDDFDVTISKEQILDGETIKADICFGSGNWMEFLQFDGTVFWKVTDKQEHWENVADLTSDCFHRIDRKLIGKGQFELAER